GRLTRRDREVPFFRQRKPHRRGARVAHTSRRGTWRPRAFPARASLLASIRGRTRMGTWTPKNHDTDVANLFEQMKKFDSSVLMTKTMDGMDRMHGRPMQIAAIDDGSAWFFTAIESNKVREAQTDS